MSAWADGLDEALMVIRDTFPSDVIYTPASTGTPVPLTGVFNAAKQVLTEAGSEGSTTSTRPTLWIRLADVSVAPAQGDTFELDSGVSYKVTDVQVDGAGGAELFAFEVAA